MLILSRLLHQYIVIDESIELYVVGVSSESVELVILGLPGEHVQRIRLKSGELANVVGDVSVVLIDASHGKARLGIEAPRETMIRRGEIAG